MSDTPATPQPLQFGWEEWISLPDLGVPALKAKVDTGARTSALHAFDIETFGPSARPKVRFTVHPIPGRDDLVIPCSAPILDRREVASSNGERELRYVIQSTLSVNGDSWPIELTLTNRSTMASRMLLGRQALKDHISIVATDRFLQPELSYDVYHTSKMRSAQPKRALRIAVLSRENNYSTRRLVEEGEKRGHTVEVIDTTRCYMAINALAPEVHYDGKRLPRYDAVVPRIGASVTAYGAAVIRQFETIGTFCVNTSAGIIASRDKLYAHQLMARAQVGMPNTAFAASPKDTSNLIGAFRGLKANFLVQDFVKEAAGEDIRCLVIGGKVMASMKRTGAEGDFRSNLHRGGSAKSVRITKTERETAIKAARVFDLNMAGVDLVRAENGPKVLEVNSSPGFEGIEGSTGKNITGALYDMIEARVRPAPVRRRRMGGKSDG
jgi:ribosomal protein S6--L-glutamate ligase